MPARPPPPDFTVAKFARDGTLLWQQTLDGTFIDGEAYSVAVDSDGNVLAAGYSLNTGIASGFTVAKFDRSGTLLWHQTFIGGTAYSVAVDTEANVLAAGYIQDTGTANGFTVAKFAPDGTRLWQQTLNGGTANSVAVDTQDNVVAAGYTGTGDFTVVKFTRDGILLWQQPLDGTAHGFDEALSVAVDTDGSVLAAGVTRNTGTGDDFTVAKFAPDGFPLWQQTLNGTANGRDEAVSVAVDTHGNVLAAGVAENGFRRRDFTVAKFAPDGTLLWQQTLHGTLGGDQALSVAVDTQGNVLAAGESANTGTRFDFTVAKFGTDEWTFCAPEGGVCTFTGTTEVRYGADGAFVYKFFTDGTGCNNSVFGDPAFGTRKSCAIRIVPTPTEWTVCAAEGGVCAFTGTMEVRYGADGVYVYQTLANGTPCTNAVFGDPIYGTVKACAIRSPPDPTEWTFCAAEDGVCSFSGTREVRYGANGVYVYQTLADGTACTNAVFGDPLYGVVKSCSVRTAFGSSSASP